MVNVRPKQVYIYVFIRIYIPFSNSQILFSDYKKSREPTHFSELVKRKSKLSIKFALPLQSCPSDKQAVDENLS